MLFFEKQLRSKKAQRFKLVTTNKKRKLLVSLPSYHTTKWFLEDLLAMEMKKIKIKINKSAHLGI